MPMKYCRNANLQAQFAHSHEDPSVVLFCEHHWWSHSHDSTNSSSSQHQLKQIQSNELCHKLAYNGTTPCTFNAWKPIFKANK